MNTPKTSAYRLSRVVALVLVVLVAGGLAYLRFASGPDTVSVPDGARAGDLSLHSCTYATEDGDYAADCGTLVVPENRDDPGSRLIALPVTRIRATSRHPKEPVFRLEGGPGKSNMHFAAASRFAGDRDVVLVGYRGADGSVRLDCPEVESAVARSTDLLAERSFRAYADAFRSCAERLTDDGVDLAGYGLVAQADDMEAARRALGYGRIDLLSESAGTRTALIYAWRHPTSIHRSVMIGVNPPGSFLWDPGLTDELVGRYAALCKRDPACSRRTDDLAATLRRTAADMPDRWLFLPIDGSAARVASFYGLMESSPEAAPLSAPMTLGAWLSAEEGDASGFWFQSLLADLAFPKSFVWGQLASAGRIDARAAKRWFASGKHHPGTEFLWAGGRLADAWPANADESEYADLRVSTTETLLVGGALDFATPPQAATRQLLPYLPNGHQVVLQGFGHTASVWSEQPDAGTHLIETFLDSGRVDASLYEPGSVDFTPEVTQTALAKGIAGAMAGLALLAVLSLLAMALRVRRRGRFGRKASALLRSLYAPVLGLGGWLAGVLVAITAMPGTPLDDELLAALSVGVPVGVGVYLAWVNRDWSARTKAVGFAAALGGALVGGWLGFDVTVDLLAVVTTVAGAVVGANLLLLALDIAWDRQARDRFAATDAREALAARPSVG